HPSRADDRRPHPPLLRRNLRSMRLHRAPPRSQRHHLQRNYLHRRHRQLPKGPSNRNTQTMDQFKAQLANIKQHSFWVMCVGILLVTMGSWWYSTGSLRSQKESQQAKIKGSFTAVTGIRGSQPKHPNLIT